MLRPHPVDLFHNRTKFDGIDGTRTLEQFTQELPFNRSQDGPQFSSSTNGA